MSPECRRRMSGKCRGRMSLLTGSRATVRGVCHNNSEVGGGAAEEGLLMIQERIAQGVYIKDIAEELGVDPRTVSRAIERRLAVRSATEGAWEQARCLQ